MGMLSKLGVRPDAGAAAARARRKKRSHVFVEPLEARCLLDCSFWTNYLRTYDGTCNNRGHRDWGSTNIALLRAAPPAYANGYSTPVVGNPVRPSTRVISNAVVAHPEEDVKNDRFLGDFSYVFGQFIDHDLDLTERPVNPAQREPFNIPVPLCDPHFDPLCTGTQVIPLSRARVVPGTGTGLGNPRQQPNQINAFIDGSVVYGSDEATADFLRSFSGGRLRTSPGNLLPVDDQGFFLAGDVRVNENIELTALHTLFMREHNRLADQIHERYPFLNDEGIYQFARALVGAEIQVIAYKEWLPALLGAHALPAYAGYRPAVNPGIRTEFSTASFRVGHSLLGNDVEFLDNNGRPIFDEIPLSEAFMNPDMVRKTGIDPILKYLVTDNADEVDTFIVDGVRNLLLDPPARLDLASINIQRGRDMGLPDYNTIRAAYGLPRVTSFAQITSDVGLQNQLRQLYGNVNNIDLWLGGLAEDHVPGSSTGPLIRRVLVDQFTRLRDGDRFWYRNYFSGDLLRELEDVTLSDVLRRNTTISNVQDNAFFFKVVISGVAFDDRNRNGRRDQGEPGLSGWTVNLFAEDEDGNPVLLASKRTGSNGSYAFDNEDGIREAGFFTVRVDRRDGWMRTTPRNRVVDITRGMEVPGVNHGFVRQGSGPEGGGEAPDDFVADALTPAAPTAAAPIPQVTAAPAVRESVSAIPAGQSVAIAQEANTARDVALVAGLEPLGAAAWAEPLQAAIWATDEIFARS